MTRGGSGTMIGVWDGQTFIGPLRHLVHKSKLFDWTRGTGPGAGVAPSDVARSIVGDLLGEPNPPPHLYRELTLQLARIPHEGGQLTEAEVRKIIKAGS